MLFQHAVSGLTQMELTEAGDYVFFEFSTKIPEITAQVCIPLTPSEVDELIDAMAGSRAKTLGPSAAVQLRWEVNRAIGRFIFTGTVPHDGHELSIGVPLHPQDVSVCRNNLLELRDTCRQSATED